MIRESADEKVIRCLDLSIETGEHLDMLRCLDTTPSYVIPLPMQTLCWILDGKGIGERNALHISLK